MRGFVFGFLLSLIFWTAVAGGIVYGTRGHESGLADKHHVMVADRDS